MTKRVTVRAKMGRPTIYTEELANRICVGIANGTSLRRLCSTRWTPTIETVRVWLLEKPDFSAQYDKARREQADYYADKITDIAEDTLRSKYEPAAARVAIDALKWTASKLKPKKYGDRLDVDNTSEVIHRFGELDDAEIDRRIKARQDRISGAGGGAGAAS